MKIDIQRHVSKLESSGEVQVHLVVTVGGTTRHTIGLGRTEEEADDKVQRSFDQAAVVVDRYAAAIREHNRFDWHKAVS